MSHKEACLLQYINASLYNRPMTAVEIHHDICLWIGYKIPINDVFTSLAAGISNDILILQEINVQGPFIDLAYGRYALKKMCPYKVKECYFGIHCHKGHLCSYIHTNEELTNARFLIKEVYKFVS